MTIEASVVQASPDWLGAKATGLAYWGIFNPNGPTLYCLGVRRDGGTGSVFMRWMHMIAGETWYCAYPASTAGSIYQGLHQSAVAIDRHVATTAGKPLIPCIPSFVVTVRDENIVHLVQHLLRHHPVVHEADWERELYYIDRYGTRLFDRAGEETRRAVDLIAARVKSLGQGESDAVQMAHLRYGNIPTFVETPPIDAPSGPFSEDAFARWWNWIQDEAYTASALNQFAQAWVGAVHILSEAEPLGQGRVERRFTTFDELSADLTRMNFPLWHESVSTRSLRASMGLLNA